jgi:ubiquinone/menaquinone biosynthesis C-methylase UbiE
MSAASPTYDSFVGDVAASYERHFVPTIPAPLADATVERAGLQPGERVLDVGCGTGIVARVAAERLGPDAQVIGVDPSPEMIEHARAISTAAGVPIQWEEGDAAQLPIDDESIDVVLSQLTLSFVGDKAGAAREIRRVLAPGGRAVINVAGAIQPLNQEMADALARHIDPNLAGFLGVVFSMPDPNQTAALLRDAGLSDVRATVQEHRFQLPPPAEFLWGYVAATPLSLFMADTPPDARQSLEADLLERWQPYVNDDGMVVDQPIVWAFASS